MSAPSRGLRHLCAVAVALGASLGASQAFAQLPRPYQCTPSESNIGPIRGTVGERTLEAATTRSNQTYGAASLAQDRLAYIAEGTRRVEAKEDKLGVELPSANDKKLFFSGLSWHTTATFGALNIPACNRKGAVVRTPVDLISGGMSYSIGIVKNLHFFYAAGVGMRVVGYEDGPRGGLAAAPLPLAIYAPVAFIKPRFSTNTGITIDFDYIVGLDVVSGKFGSIAVGYAGSSGFFSNLTEHHARLFAGAVVDKVAENIDSPFLAGGVQSLDWLLGDAAVKALGHTKLFGQRQLQVAPPASDLVQRASEDRPRVGRFSTINLEETEIAGFIDATLRMTVEPKVDLYEATLGAHSSGVGGHLDLFARAGVVKLPNLWFYGVEGGYKPRIEGGVGFGRTLPGRHVIETAIGVNDAEVLSVFPYAYNAVQFRFRVGI